MAEIALSVKETARALGISESAVYWMVWRNEIPHRRTTARGRKGQLMARKEKELEEAKKSMFVGSGGLLTIQMELEALKRLIKKRGEKQCQR